MSEQITITHSTDADIPSVRDLADLDGRRPPHGPALLAYVDGELRAAVGLLDGRSVADPFRRTAHIVELLRLQAQQEVPRMNAALSWAVAKTGYPKAVRRRRVA